VCFIRLGGRKQRVESVRGRWNKKFEKHSFRGTCSSIEMLKSYMAWESLGTPSLVKLTFFIQLCCETVHITIFSANTLIFHRCKQARNRLGTPGGAKSFLRGAQTFKAMSNSFKVCPTHFLQGERKIVYGELPPPALPGYGPRCNVFVARLVTVQVPTNYKW